jgi:hypothetical protein
MGAAPQDNHHCFKGMGLAIWRDRARGLQPLDTVGGPNGHRISYQADAQDGFALNTGGIATPCMVILPMRPLIRFLRAGVKPADAYGGNWWLDLDAYPVLSSYALNQGLTLAQAAQRLLVVPQEWSDCAQMVVVRPRVALMAYTGKGKPVALNNGRNVSPDAIRLSGTRVYYAPQGTNIEQIYIPGERQFLSAWFTFISGHSALQGGGARPPL